MQVRHHVDDLAPVLALNHALRFEEVFGLAVTFDGVFHGVRVVSQDVQSHVLQWNHALVEGDVRPCILATKANWQYSGFKITVRDFRT